MTPFACHLNDTHFHQRHFNGNLKTQMTQLPSCHAYIFNVPLQQSFHVSRNMSKKIKAIASLIVLLGVELEEEEENETKKRKKPDYWVQNLFLNRNSCGFYAKMCNMEANIFKRKIDRSIFVAIVDAYAFHKISNISTFSIFSVKSSFQSVVHLRTRLFSIFLLSLLLLLHQQKDLLLLPFSTNKKKNMPKNKKSTEFNRKQGNILNNEYTRFVQAVGVIQMTKEPTRRHLKNVVIQMTKVSLNPFPLEASFESKLNDNDCHSNGTDVLFVYFHWALCHLVTLNARWKTSISQNVLES